MPECRQVMKWHPLAAKSPRRGRRRRHHRPFPWPFAVLSRGRVVAPTPHQPVHSRSDTHAREVSMTSKGLSIEADISRASTLPAAVYHDPTWYELQKERV